MIATTVAEELHLRVVGYNGLRNGLVIATEGTRMTIAASWSYNGLRNGLVIATM